MKSWSFHWPQNLPEFQGGVQDDAWTGSLHCEQTSNSTFIIYKCTFEGVNLGQFFEKTFGGRALKIENVPLGDFCPADAKFNVAASLVVVRDHLKGDKPPLARTRFD